MTRPKVLLADDNDGVLRVVAQLLKSEFEVVKTVNDGQAAVDEALRLEPDVVVLDISMPVLNGIEAALLLKAGGTKAKVVFLTIHDDEEYVRAALDAGALAYVIKCRLASDLPIALRQALAGRLFVSPSQVEAKGEKLVYDMASAVPSSAPR